MKFPSPNKTRIYKAISAFLKELSFSFALILFVALYPATANAGFFSSILSDLTSTKVSANVISSVPDQNSQNMPILTAPTNVNPNPLLAENSLPVSGDSLTAEVGPDGTTADVDQPTNTQISVYVVRTGDTLSKISQLFDVSVGTILWANNLNSQSVISAGDTLVILPVSGIQYTVKAKDTLQGIVKKYNADINEVLQYNDIASSSSLTVGEIILIPNAEPTTLINPVTTTKYSSSHPGYGAPGSNPAHDTGGPSYPTCDVIVPGCVYLRPIDGGHKSQGLHGYNAVDLAAPIGTPIHASEDGTVIISKVGGWNGGYGSYVVISHPNGTQTLYAHASKNLVSVGERVVQGQTIALIGMTGETTGPHVHFEIRGARNPF